MPASDHLPRLTNIIQQFVVCKNPTNCVVFCQSSFNVGYSVRAHAEVVEDQRSQNGEQ